MKKLLTSLYFALCLAAMSGEPVGDITALKYYGYYLFVLVNFGVASLLVNKVFKTEKENETT